MPLVFFVAYISTPTLLLNSSFLLNRFITSFLQELIHHLYPEVCVYFLLFSKNEVSKLPFHSNAISILLLLKNLFCSFLSLLSSFAGVHWLYVFLLFAFSDIFLFLFYLRKKKNVFISSTTQSFWNMLLLYVCCSPCQLLTNGKQDDMFVYRRRTAPPIFILWSSNYLLWCHCRLYFECVTGNAYWLGLYALFYFAA